MAKRERNKRAARKARQKEREENQQTQVADPNAQESKPKVEAAKPKAKDKPKKDGVTGKVGKYFSGVKSEMHRVVWPTKKELKDYSIGVFAMLILFGVSIWLFDNAVVMCLTTFAKLRG